MLRFANRQTYIENPWLEKFHQTVPTCCLFRRTSFDRLGGYRTFLRFAYDWDLFFRFMTMSEGVLFLPEILSIYRKHEQQTSVVAGLGALYDVLDLWQFKEYSHFRSWEVADLVIQHLHMAMLAKSDWLDIILEVRRRNLLSRVLWGSILCFPRRVGRKMARNASYSIENGRYQVPSNLDHALQTAAVVAGN